MKLRDYQSSAIQQVRDHIRQGSKKIIIRAPTGAGKTVIASFIINGAVKLEKNILFLAHRKELINQSSDKLDQLYVWHGVIMAKHPRHAPALSTQVASLQTLVRRLGDDVRPDADLIIVDECHRSVSASYTKILECYPNAIVIGLTATPERTDGRGLGEFYDKIVQVSTIKELTKLGFLVPSRVMATERPKLSEIRTVRGDYDEKQTAEMFNTPTLTGILVKNYERFGGGRLAVVFAINVAHSKAIVQKFLNAGHKAAHVDGTTLGKLRDKILSDLALGIIKVVSNVGILTEGWDCPPVSCGILARPTQSRGLYHQMVGRFLRPHPGKTDALTLRE